MIQTVEALAVLVNGTVQGDCQRKIDDAAAIETAGPSAVTFVQDENHVRRLKGCQAGAIVVEAKVAAAFAESPQHSLIVVSDAQASFQKILPLFRKIRSRPEPGISPHAHVSQTAQLGTGCYVAAGVVIGDEVVVGANCELHPGVVIGPGCRIGNQTVLYPNCVLYHDVVIGNNVIIHSGSVIGADGFGYRFAGGKFEKIPQLGTVQIDDDVEIGACSTIDRGAIGPTVIGTGTKIDNLVMIAHNCEIGRHNAFASQVGIAGSSSTGDYVRLGGQAGVRDHVRLNSGCTVGAKAGVVKDVPAGEMWIGIPATHEMDQKRIVVANKRLPEMRDHLQTLEQRITDMAAEIERLQGTISKTQTAPGHRAAG